MSNTSNAHHAKQLIVKMNGPLVAFLMFAGIRDVTVKKDISGSVEYAFLKVSVEEGKCDGNLYYCVI